jgi:hypothetical protein
MKTPRTESVVRMAVGPMREYAIIEHAQNLERELIESVRCQDILASAMAEIKATHEGHSNQPITDIIAGCIAEIHCANNE